MLICLSLVDRLSVTEAAVRVSVGVLGCRGDAGDPRGPSGDPA